MDVNATAEIGTTRGITADLARRGGALLVGAALTALAVTAAAAFVDPTLARPATPGYLASGAVMTLVDAIAALGLAGLAGTGAVAAGRLKPVAFGLLVGGSLAMVPAELLLRADFAAGNAAYGIAGPVQAVGLVLVGIGIIRSGRWSSWRRFVVLGWGAYVPLVMMPLLIASGGSSLVALAGYHVWALLAGAAYTSSEARTAGA